tara:strand:+ start:42 stop:170 length:129 start_codon:yes stop_codon:yes gene_type:complete
MNSKKGVVTHPVVLFIVAVIIGLALAYVIGNYTALPPVFCGK